MEPLSDVSQTALITLRSRVIESEATDSVLHDPMGRVLLERLTPRLPDAIQQGVLSKKLSRTLTRHIALRARQYDAYARTFLDRHANGLVVSLGCGFDTRYWRISNEPWRYVEVDLPGVVDAKRAVLGDLITYPIIGASVTEDGWTDQVRKKQASDVLLLAEGLLMYLTEPDVKKLFARLSSSFIDSKFVFETVHDRYTKGFWKKRVEARMKRGAGSDAGASFNFGVHSAQDVEAFGEHIRVVDEWSYLEDNDVYPRFMHRLRNVPLFSRSQWTVAVAIGATM